VLGLERRRRDRLAAGEAVQLVTAEVVCDAELERVVAFQPGDVDALRLGDGGEACVELLLAQRELRFAVHGGVRHGWREGDDGRGVLKRTRQTRGEGAGRQFQAAR